jgi:eukaryotic-like serine/threonine-protein kinase
VSEAQSHPPTIPGYTLVSRLGAGGYGEVWLAHASGGLTKAVKIIYGSFNDRRAELELRSLHKIKAVRHPFLLSLERIEVVENRLIIVTELADSSLKDRYDECRRAGMPGIPRDELLRYLRDAADALDYLGERHSLQHLDVKPENLLLVGGHIKVADFGLVKEVGRTQASLVGGLTPLYSSPEVFQGTPGARSDQYSLAVVYQEMLTGVAPFGGATAAELTVQHLQGEPDLSPLPMQDRFALARALAKDPAQRFASCIEMVDALNSGGNGFNGRASDSSSGSFDDVESAFPERRAEPRPGPVSQFFHDRGRPAPLAGRNNAWVDSSTLAPPQLRTFDAATFAEGSAASPAVVIGIGGLAGRVLKRLRQRLSRELGDERRVAVELLLLDTDARSISAAVQGTDRTALRPEETLALPLRRPQEYREDSALLMRWLSRRWLYNIPKSLQTEGLRPLGRLAFVDHARQVGDRIAAALRRGHEACAAAGSSTSPPAGHADPLRVYVVAGVGGGTGGGMSLDVGYAIRALAAQQGIAELEVTGLFLHATGRDARKSELARVNSFAWLREFNHYHRPEGSYPGDEGCALPSFPAETKAFDAAYFLDLGVVGDDESLGDVASDVAEYLFLDAVTPARSFFDACRNDSSPVEDAPLRSFRLSTATAADDRAIQAASVSLCRAVLMEWLGCGPGQRRSLPAVEMIDLSTLASRTRDAIVRELAPQWESPDLSSTGLADAIRRINAAFTAPDDQPGVFLLGRPIDELVRPIADEIAATTTSEVLAAVDDPSKRLAGAGAALEASRQRSADLEAEATKLAAAIGQQAAGMIAQLERWLRERSAANAARESELLDVYRQLLLDQRAMLAAAIVAKRLLAELGTLADRLGEVARQIKGFIHNYPQSAALEGDAPFAVLLYAELPNLTATVASRLEQEYIQPSGGLLAVATGSPRVREQLVIALNRLATCQAEALATSPALIAKAGMADSRSADRGLAEDEQGRPTVSCLGGVMAWLETTPRAAGPATWSVSGETARLEGAGSQVVRCCEAWNLSLPLIAGELIQHRRDCLELADRVSSRCDVEWTPLCQSAGTPAPALSTFEVDPSAVTMTQVL